MMKHVVAAHIEEFIAQAVDRLSVEEYVQVLEELEGYVEACLAAAQDDLRREKE